MTLIFGSIKAEQNTLKVQAEGHSKSLQGHSLPERGQDIDKDNDKDNLNNEIKYTKGSTIQQVGNKVYISHPNFDPEVHGGTVRFTKNGYIMIQTRI